VYRASLTAGAQRKRQHARVSVAVPHRARLMEGIIWVSVSAEPPGPRTSLPIAVASLLGGEVAPIAGVPPQPLPGEQRRFRAEQVAIGGFVPPVGAFERRKLVRC